MRRSEDFRRTVRHGVRAGRRTVVVHALRLGRADVAGNQSPAPGDPAISDPAIRDPATATPLVGFVVSKAIGSAVRRNRVRRRLRHLCVPHLDAVTEPTLVVVRALPPAATAGRELGSDLDDAWTSALAKLVRR
jgi:ribonuclease P protein component